MKRQLKKPKFWFTDSAEAEKQTENNTSLTENVLFVIDNATKTTHDNYFNKKGKKFTTDNKLHYNHQDINLKKKKSKRNLIVDEYDREMSTIS